MNFGTKGCMYNCGDECTGECMKVETKTKMIKEELDKILLNPDYAESLGIKVYVEVKDNGEKYAVLNNGKEELRLKIKQR